MIDVDKTIISQYDKSTTIRNIIDLMNQWIDPKNDIDNIYNKIWNIDTAEGFGLDILGGIIGVRRDIYYAADKFFGFVQAFDPPNELSKIYPFGQQPFYTKGTTSGSFSLTDDAYRKLIFIKAMSNISSLTAESINKILLYIFDGKRCYVNDLGKMAMRYVFEFSLSEYEFFLVTSKGILPRPAGVSTYIIQINQPIFGFDSSLSPFNVGTFFSKGINYVAS